ncbi:S9 family peptidase [Chelativorans intermedius]|uniref:S9 family peptidase n=1 Tax=Chelativorans intermedius TaxID=515947 RepID=A0ABV6D8Y6_9HYPH|nr:S9 family peptidase [Chelativorans intermedius]MCT8998749.1 S9 family peptidase [Chelativorans intermedius]
MRHEKIAAFPSAPAPRPEKRPQEDTRHGITRIDEYAWLRAENWQEVLKDPAQLAPDIRAHLEAENAYHKQLMAGTEALQEALFAEMKGRIKEDDSSVPMKDGPYAYGSAWREGGEYPRFFRTPREGGAEEVLLDGDREAEGKSYFHIGGVDHSPDHTRLVWGADEKGSEFYTLRVRDIASGRDLADQVENTGGSGVFNADGSGFFYTLLDENHRPSKLFFHPLGAAEEDRLIYEEPDPGFFMSVSGSRLNDWILICSHNHETSEYRILPADDSHAEPRLVAARETGLQYDLEPAGEEFFILTNADGAKDFKIMTAPAADPSRENWREVVAHEPGRLILSILAFKDHLVRLERKDGLPRIVVRERAGGAEHVIAFEEEAYSLGLAGALEYDTDTFRFTYSSMTTPTQEFDYDMRTRRRTLLKTQEVPSGHTPQDYVTRRLMAPAPDGELVPISLVHRRGLKLDGSAPCLLYGYGAYGITIPAAFRTNCLSLVDRGFVYAIAHVRGGKDKGYRWYEEGKREKKPNTFTDFIACARHLVAEGYTSHDRLVAEGGSAGGMLMGAIANMAPQDFRAIVAGVPFVDVLNTMLDDTLPLTPPEWPEWGNPIASNEDFEVIAAYSPYDNVRPQPYPAILALAGLTDPRVTYWEPAKWVARLRDHNTGDNPIMLKINLDAGHAGASGRFSRLEEVAFSYAFMLKAVGMAA